MARNEDLEQLLGEVNALLGPANSQLLEDVEERFPKVFLVGAMRSGTTLFSQCLAASGLFAYPTNLLSRFYGAPLVGAKIQMLLTDPRYNFRNEILDFRNPVGFSSTNGKTTGALAPNEFWYFWRRFLPNGGEGYLPDEELRAAANLEGLRDELNGLCNIFGKPFALKAMILNQNIGALAELFGRALFVWVRRDPVFTIQSVLQARRRQYGNLDAWYSFRIREFPQLEKLDPLQSVAGQVAAINLSIEESFRLLPETNRLVVSYEQFCRQPSDCLDALVARLGIAEQRGSSGPAGYLGDTAFGCSNAWTLPEYSESQAREAYAAMNASLRTA